jgi:hypothetical protein
VTTIGAPPARSRLTSILFNYLTANLNGTILVGRGQAPPAGGWAKGQPGVSSFVPYVTVKAAQARPGPSPESLGRPRQAWQVGYTLSCSGQLEASTDDTADQVRDALTRLEGPFDLRGVTWTLLTVMFNSLGSLVPNNSTNPPFWDVSDAVSLWLFRDRGQSSP